MCQDKSLSDDLSKFDLTKIEAAFSERGSLDVGSASIRRSSLMVVSVCGLTHRLTLPRIRLKPCHSQ
jgi:hypothetical protein